MNERRDDWAQAFGESVSIAAIGFGLLGITQDHAARFRSAKRVLGSLRDHAALFLGERSMILAPREKKLLRRFAKVRQTDRAGNRRHRTARHCTTPKTNRKGFEFSQKSSLWQPPTNWLLGPLGPRSDKSESGRR